MRVALSAAVLTSLFALPALTFVQGRQTQRPFTMLVATQSKGDPARPLAARAATTQTVVCRPALAATCH